MKSDRQFRHTGANRHTDRRTHRRTHRQRTDNPGISGPRRSQYIQSMKMTECKKKLDLSKLSAIAAEPPPRWIGNGVWEGGWLGKGGWNIGMGIVLFRITPSAQPENYLKFGLRKCMRIWFSKQKRCPYSIHGISVHVFRMICP